MQENGKYFIFVFSAIYVKEFFVPRHLGTLVWCAEAGTVRTTLTHSWSTQQNQRDTLGNHSPGSEDAEEDENSWEDVAETKFERDVETVGEGGGGEDTHTLVWCYLKQLDNTTHISKTNI